jgi:hypothetical protein
MRAEADRLWGKPLEEPHRRGVMLVMLFNSIDIQKDYRGYSMVFDGRKIRKLVPGVDMDLPPSRKELIRFLKDVSDAAEHDEKIWEYLERNPLPYRLIRRR